MIYSLNTVCINVLALLYSLSAKGCKSQSVKVAYISWNPFAIHKSNMKYYENYIYFIQWISHFTRSDSLSHTLGIRINEHKLVSFCWAWAEYYIICRMNLSDAKCGKSHFETCVCKVRNARIVEKCFGLRFVSDNLFENSPLWVRETHGYIVDTQSSFRCMAHVFCNCLVIACNRTMIRSLFKNDLNDFCFCHI